MSFTSFKSAPLRTREQVAREVHEVSLRRNLDELATVICLMAISTEVGTGEGDSRKWWCPANPTRDPETTKFPNDSTSDDSRSSGYLQQQNGPKGERWWGDPIDRMTLARSVDMFLDRLADDYTRAEGNAKLAGQFAQKVQGSSFPDRYAGKWDEAWAVLRRALGTSPSKQEVPVMGDPVWLADVLRAEGLTCDVLDGAFDRGQGDFGAIWGVICHHTGSNPPSNNPNHIANHPTLGLASQLHLARDGKFTLCGVGIAYHAGQGSWPGIQANNANQVTIGIEAENNGTEGWSTAQYGSYVKGVAAILRKLGVGPERAIGHKEWAAIQGKWDPGGIDMNAFRRDVTAAISAAKPVVVVNEIDEAAKRNPWVGARVRPEELTVGDGKGRLGVYENAHIYFYPGVGAFPIPNEHGLFDAYAEQSYERGPLGYPVREYTSLDGGGVQAFQGGVLYRKDGEKGFVVGGAIGKRWADDGYERGPLGWPTSNEYTDSDLNRAQLFEHGSLLWHSTGVSRLTVKKG